MQHAPMAMNWLHFKAKFSGNPEEDPEPHILRTVDWMDTYDFAQGQRVQIFSLTLADRSQIVAPINTSFQR